MRSPSCTPPLSTVGSILHILRGDVTGASLGRAGVGLIACCIAAMFLMACHGDRDLEKRFFEISTGMTAAEVVEILGKPARVDRAPFSESAAPGCTTEKPMMSYVYERSGRSEARIFLSHDSQVLCKEVAVSVTWVQ